MSPGAETGGIAVVGSVATTDGIAVAGSVATAGSAGILTSVAGHRDIVLGIERRDGPLAEVAMRSHILGARHAAVRSASDAPRGHLA